METVDIGRFIASFCFVVGLIFVVAWVAKRLGLERRFAAKTQTTPQLQIIERLAVDPRHRLVLIRRGTREHLLLLGATTDLLIESYEIQSHDAPAAQSLPVIPAPAA